MEGGNFDLNFAEPFDYVEGNEIEPDLWEDIDIDDETLGLIDEIIQEDNSFAQDNSQPSILNSQPPSQEELTQYVTQHRNPNTVKQTAGVSHAFT